MKIKILDKNKYIGQCYADITITRIEEDTIEKMQVIYIHTIWPYDNRGYVRLKIIIQEARNEIEINWPIFLSGYAGPLIQCRYLYPPTWVLQSIEGLVRWIKLWVEAADIRFS